MLHNIGVLLKDFMFHNRHIGNVFNEAVENFKKRSNADVKTRPITVYDEISIRLWEENFWDTWWFCNVDWNQGDKKNHFFGPPDLQYIDRFSDALRKVVTDDKGNWSEARHRRLGDAIPAAAIVKWVEFANKCAQDMPEFITLSLKSKRTVSEQTSFNTLRNNFEMMAHYFEVMNSNIFRFSKKEAEVFKNMLIRPQDAKILYEQAVGFKLKHEKALKSRWR